MKKLTFLITSGPTREYIDPVRFLSNASSGKMGQSLAEAVLRKGHKVVFISGPTGMTPPERCRYVPIVSAREMFAQVKEYLPGADVVIGAAAVADYRPAKLQRHKIKKSDAAMTLSLIPNPDIIRYVGKRKGSRVVVGFALESKALLASARKKLREKNLDLIVANAPSAIGSASSSVWLIDSGDTVTAVKDADKKTVAERIINEALRILETR